MEEELEALQSVYDTLSIVSGDKTELTMLCRSRHTTSFVSALIQIELPTDYPAACLRSFHIVKSCGLIDEGASIVRKIHAFLSSDTNIEGEPILFQLLLLVFDCLDASNQGECLICAEELLISPGKEGQGLLTKCCHSFHTSCLSRWAAISMCQSRLRAQGSTAQSRDDSELRHLQGTIRSVEKEIEGLQITINKWQEEIAQLTTFLSTTPPLPPPPTTSTVTATSTTTGTGTTTASTASISATPISSISALKLAIKERRSKLSDTVGAMQKASKADKTRLTQETTNLRQEILQFEGKLSELEERIKQVEKGDNMDIGTGLDKGLNKHVDHCLTKSLNHEKNTALQRLQHLQSSMGESENKRIRCEKKLDGHRRELTVANERLRDKGVTSASLQKFPCPVCREALLAAGGEDIGLTVETDIQRFRSMISDQIIYEKQEIERMKRQKDGPSENETMISTTETIRTETQGSMQGGSMQDHESKKMCCDLHSVFCLPLELQEYVRKIQREQQILRDSRTKNKS